MGAVLGTAAQVAAGLDGCLHGGGQLRRVAVRRDKHGLHRACADGKAVLPLRRAGGCTGQDREMGRAHRLVLHLQPRRLAQADVGQNIAVIGHRGKLRQRHPARPVQLDLAVQRQKQRQHIGKAEPAIDAAAHRGAVAELYADNVAHSLPHSPRGGGIQGGVRFQIAQRCHSAEGRQVDGRADIDLFHLEPEHTAQHAVGLFLVQLPCLLQRGGAGIFAYRHHGSISVFFYFGRKNHTFRV